jgi:hypothetical protein
MKKLTTIKWNTQNNENSGEDSYYYSGIETKKRNECFMTEILEEQVTYVNLFWKKVAIQKGMQNPEVWAKQVKNKFELIGIGKVSDTMMNVFRINLALKKKELSQFYTET